MVTDFRRVPRRLIVPLEGEVFGDLLRRYRTTSGLTQEALAERAGISARTISDVERGLRRNVYRNTAARLADVFELAGTDRDTFLALAQRGAARSANRSTIGVDASAPRLPSPLTRLVGRESEVAAILAAVQSPEVRVLTLLGPGGIGKTRLAIEVATRADFRDGAFFVSLAATADPDLVASLIARELRLTGIRTSVPEALRNHLSEREVLIVLDTFEHVLAASPFVAELAEACPGLSVLVTSRAPLQVRGEHEFAVAPLAIPDAGVDAANLNRYPATMLFLEHAHAVKPYLVIDEESAPVIIDICRKLDGLPLALGLAAVRLRHLSLAAVQRQLDHRLNLLVGGPRDLPRRQQAMRDTIAWSYDLLEPPEQSLFRRLSVFSGGWTLVAAESVLALEDDRDRLLSQLSALVDNNLVTLGNLPGEESRYGMLDVIREFAFEQAEAHGETTDLSRRHATYFAELAEAAEPEFGGSGQAAWYRRLQVEEDNMRGAMAWSLEPGDGELALRLAGALWLFWRRHGDYTEGRLWLDRALAIPEPPESAPRRKALWGNGWLTYYQGDYERAQRFGDELLRLSRAAHDEVGVRNALTVRGIVAMAEKRYADALPQLEEALRIAREHGPEWLLATSVLNLGTAMLHTADVVRSQMLLEEALRLYRRLGDRLFVARTLGYLGYNAVLRADLPAARRLATSSLKQIQGLAERFGVAEGLQAMAMVNAAERRDERAAELAGAANALWESISAQALAPDRAIATPYFDAARERLGASAWRSAWNRGATMKLADAIAQAVERSPLATSNRSGLPPAELMI